MLEEMGYASATERDGRKIYAVTEEGRQFLNERKDLADDVKDHMRHHWNPENIGVLGEIMDDFGELRRLVGRRLRHADTEKIQRIREVVSRAIKDIQAILEEKGD